MWLCKYSDLLVTNNYPTNDNRTNRYLIIGEEHLAEQLFGTWELPNQKLNMTPNQIRGILIIFLIQRTLYRLLTVFHESN